MKTSWIRFSALSLTLGLTAVSLAGGPVKTNAVGDPIHWAPDATIVYNPNNEGLKSEGGYGTEASLNLVKSAFSAWTSLPGIQLKTSQGPFLNGSGAVNVENFAPIFYGGTKDCYPELVGPTENACVSPIIFDPHGEIIESLFGECSQFEILAVANVDDMDNGTTDPKRLIARRGRAILSGACIPPVSTKAGCGTCAPLSEDDIRTMLTHELGHFLGMGHSQVNPKALEACDAGQCDGKYSQAFPSMFPRTVSGSTMYQPHPDDISFFQSLYAPQVSKGYCAVSGKVSLSDGTGAPGIEIVARNVDAALELRDAVAGISGRNSPHDIKGNCTERCDEYEIIGLKPGNTYKLCAQKINPVFKDISNANLQLNKSYQTFNDYCPDGLTIKCECSDPAQCPEFKDKNLMLGSGGAVTPAVNQAATPASAPAVPSASGCSLHRP